MAAYYNEFDEQAAAWLRELIRRGLIAPGDVDTRSIVDVRPDDLAGYTQCHFFAGIGVWSYALRRAGWPDDRPVWTGSPPCQPFSAAGKGLGVDDERHLWPAFFHLINICRPDVLFAEQVASKDGLAWVENVSADMEGAAYAFGAVDLCAAGFGAPHIRQRLFMCGTNGLADPSRHHRWSRLRGHDETGRGRLVAGDGGSVLQLGHTLGEGLEGYAGNGDGASGRAFEAGSASPAGQPSGLALPNDAFWGSNLSRGDFDNRPDAGRSEGAGDVGLGGGACGWPGATNGHWGDVDWLLCRDGKWRPVEPGTFPLAHGASARVGRLRGYGNAIVAPVAEGFIRSYLEAESDDFDRMGACVVIEGDFLDLLS